MMSWMREQLEALARAVVALRRSQSFVALVRARAWTRRHPLITGTLLFAMLPALGYGLGWLLAPAQHPAAEVAAAPLVEASPVAEPQAPPDEPLDVVEGVLRSGETLSSRLREQGVSDAVIDTIVTQMRPVFDFRYARPGDRYWLGRDQNRAPVLFRYARPTVERYVLRREGDGFVATRFEPGIELRVVRLDGVVSTSLYDAIGALGENPQLSLDFAQIFAWDVDFARALPGDEFSMVYERRFLIEDEREAYIGPGRILAARYSNARDDHAAVYFETSESRGGYYRRDGSSVERQFLRAPLKYSRISSRYSLNRLHPVMKVRRPHPAIDYAAPRGTPVWSVADGRVIFRGVLGGLGKTVKVRHTNGYVTYYGHLSRFARGLQPGERILQQQVLGYVGATGIATGPHLDYRVKHHGRYVNPAEIETPAGDPIPEPLRARFEVTWSRYSETLDPADPLRVATQEAL